MDRYCFVRRWMHSKLRASSVAVVGLTGALACSKPAQSDSSPSLVPMAAAGQAPAAANAEQGVPAVLNAYEAIRAALAADDLAGAQTAAKQLATIAADAGKSASAAQVAGLKAIAEAATAEAALAPADATAVRKQFGEVSKHLVALVTSDTKLQQGRYVFECPMAPGYGKWIQTDTQVANPYMGKRMLECGSKSTW